MKLEAKKSMLTSYDTFLLVKGEIGRGIRESTTSRIDDSQSLLTAVTPTISSICTEGAMTPGPSRDLVLGTPCSRHVTWFLALIAL